ncbi:MAG: M20/M25/M40 family metallo-hydrolase [Acidobacteria bacterium]|nr:M20/M25/M40 family metallo-hydrolase [Acidobacteriota bacterium]
MLITPSDVGAQAVPRPYDLVSKQIIREAMCEPGAYQLLEGLTRIGPRLSGSQNAAAAVRWGYDAMVSLGFEDVHLEPVMVPVWERGDIERAHAVVGSGPVVPLAVCALGSSVATPAGGIEGEVVEVHTWSEVDALGATAKGRIVFFNRPMDAGHYNTFEAYGEAVDQRGGGPVAAAKVGACAVLIRSMTLAIDDVPHTGNTHYEDGVPRIPAAAISTLSADTLHSLLDRERDLKVRLELTCETKPDALSANVIGEIRGREKPEEVVIVGGHLDSWDKGQGAHDDGAGCAQAMESLRILKELDLAPRRTIRAVLFMNEENGLRGGREYAAVARGDRHVAAIESDAGGFAPRGFGVNAPRETLDLIARWSYLLAPMGADRIIEGHGGVDIWPLSLQGVPAIGLMPESQRYFDYHHSDKDVIAAVNPRELQLGAAAMAILAYVIAEEGLEAGASQ